MAKKTTLKTKANEILYPQTKADIVYTSTNTDVQTILTTYGTDIARLKAEGFKFKGYYTSVSQFPTPTPSAEGVGWYAVLRIENNYVLLCAKPLDWETNYTNYYTKSGNDYIAVTGETAPAFALNTYYEKKDEDKLYIWDIGDEDWVDIGGYTSYGVQSVNNVLPQDGDVHLEAENINAEIDSQENTIQYFLNDLYSDVNNLEETAQTVSWDTTNKKLQSTVNDVTTDLVQFGTTAISNDYDDLTNKPDLSIYAQSANLATVATSGDYDDLSDKPIINADLSSITGQTTNQIYRHTGTTAGDFIQYQLYFYNGTDWKEVGASLPETTTAGQVLKSTYDNNTFGVAWGDAGLQKIDATNGITLANVATGIYEVTGSGNLYTHYSDRYNQIRGGVLQVDATNGLFTYYGQMYYSSAWVGCIIYGGTNNAVTAKYNPQIFTFQPSNGSKLWGQGGALMRNCGSMPQSDWDDRSYYLLGCPNNSSVGTNSSTAKVASDIKISDGQTLMKGNYYYIYAAGHGGVAGKILKSTSGTPGAEWATDPITTEDVTIG